MLMQRLNDLVKKGYTLTDFEHEQALACDWTLEGERAEEKDRFRDVYIERVEKEAEAFIQSEEPPFLQEPLTYVKNHKNEFIYIESPWFDIVQIDGVAIEWDDVFQTYTALFGFMRRKKETGKLKEILSDVKGAQLQFNGQDGLFEMNLQLLEIGEIKEEMALAEVLSHLYQFLFQVVLKLESDK
ncbi:branched-chain amino acid aminotransferase [Bacillus sp. NPDC077027]|uniref:branched-chain amino acid aminotransferase n=1 Tax=Bacillus sp. NPDC077027 TaxID=3390548 RepID=UPI003D02AA87